MTDLPEINLLDVSTRLHVVYLHPGTPRPSHTTCEVQNRDAERDALTAPDDTFGFFYRVGLGGLIDDGYEQKWIYSRPVALTRRYYIDAEVIDLDDPQGPQDDQLDELRSEGWRFAVRCRTGNFEQYDPLVNQVINIT